MNMFYLKCFYFILLICIINTTLAAKIDSLNKRNASVEFSIGSGYTSFDVSPLRFALQNALQNYKFLAKITDNFPNQPYYAFEASLVTKSNFALGLKYSSVSTGSRICYNDYSGNYTFDNILNCYQYGLNFKLKVGDDSNFAKIDLTAGLGLFQINLKSTETYNIFNQKQSNSEVLESEHYYFEPGIRIYYMWQKIIFGVCGTYNIEFNKETTLKFGGIRIGVLLGFRF